jgi:hypothetical protein
MKEPQVKGRLLADMYCFFLADEECGKPSQHTKDSPAPPPQNLPYSHPITMCHRVYPCVVVCRPPVATVAASLRLWLETGL